MAHCDRFRAQHDTLVSLVGEVQAKARMNDAAAAHATLTKMTGLILVHLAAEDNALYPRLMQTQCSKTKAVANDFIKEMGSLKDAYVAFTTKWTRAAMAANISGFMKEADQVFGALAKRIERENHTLYPLADQAA